MPSYISEEQNQMRYDRGSIMAYGTIYQDKSPAIMLRGAEDSAPIAKATINIPQEDIPFALFDDDPQPHRVVAIKNYSENEGVLETLMNADIVVPLIAVQQGHIIIHYAYITSESVINDINEALGLCGKSLSVG